MRIKIKPLSVNDAWQGKRYKTNKYKDFEEECLFKLRPKRMPPAPYEVYIIVGLSSKNADLDNIVKPFLDVLQKKYGINDKDIFKIILEKRIVKKGDEYIDFEIDYYE